MLPRIPCVWCFPRRDHTVCGFSAGPGVAKANYAGGVTGSEVGDRDGATAPVAGANNQELLALAGLAAYTQLRLFSQVAAHVWGAPTLDQQERLLNRAMRIGGRQNALLEIGAEHGVPAVQLMAPVKGIYDSFVARTAPSSWWEGLLRPIVTHGITRELVLLLATGLPEAERARFDSILADNHSQDEVGLEIVAGACQADPVLGSRLSLWGRRVAGEALQICANVVNSNPPLASLLVRAAAVGKAADGKPNGQLALPDAVRWMQAQLTAGHAKRMEKMGLAA